MKSELFKDSWEKLTSHLEKVKQNLNGQNVQIDHLIKDLIKHRNNNEEIILLGVGRCENILNLFMTRLLQQPISFEKDKLSLVSEKSQNLLFSKDSLVICLSGSGITKPTVAYAKRCVEKGAKLALITSNLNGPLIPLADYYIHISGLTDKDFNKPEYAYGSNQPIYFENIHPGPTYFECSVVILLDSIISVLNQIIIKNSN